MTEEEYRKMLVAKTRKRARQIQDGSYINEPWAPSPSLSRMIKVIEHGD